MPEEYQKGTQGGGYERRDVHIRGLGWFVVLFVTVGLILHVAVYFLMGLLSGGEASRQIPAASVAASDRFHERAAETPLPPAPPLQPSPGHASLPWQDMRDFQIRKERMLSTYAWADSHKKMVRIPIERAMELALAHHLLEEPATRPNGQTAAPETRPGEPLPGAGEGRP